MTEPSRFVHFNALTTVIPAIDIPAPAPSPARVEFYNTLDPETRTCLSDRHVGNRIRAINPELHKLATRRLARPDGGVYSWSQIYDDFSDRQQQGQELSESEIVDWTMSRIMAGISDAVTRNHCDPDTLPVDKEKAGLLTSIYAIRDPIGPDIEDTLYRITDEFVK